MKVKDLKNIIAYMQLRDWEMDRDVDDMVANAKAQGWFTDEDIYERKGKNGMTLYEEWEERYRNYTNLINWIYKNKFEAIYGCYDYLRKDR